MKKILKGTLAAILTIALTIPMFSVAAMAEETPTVNVPVSVTLTGSKLSAPETLNVVLTAKDAVCPMPEGAADGVYKLATTGGGEYSLGPIVFGRVGIHHYTIHQEAGTHSRGTYDTKVYDMTISCTNKEGGGLETTVVLHLDGVEAKPGKVEFSNSYRSSGGGGGGSSSSGGGGGTPSGGPGTTTITDGEIPSTTILPFDVPLALPQTGTLWWLVPILAVAGIAMFFVGMIKGRKKSEDDEL